MRRVHFVSGCLAGLCCRYDGGHKHDPELLSSLEGEPVIFECPEVLGGLTTPRSPAAINKGDGQTVLDGTSKVISKEKQDVTKAFVKGAHATLKLIKSYNITDAWLKAKSPSCGVSHHSVFGKLRKGAGVTAALLAAHGVTLHEV